MFARPLVELCEPVLARLNALGISMAKYAVAVGKKVGVYDTWAECQIQVLGHPNAVYKKFDTRDEAESFIKNFSVGVSSEAEYFKHIPAADKFRPEKFQIKKPLNPPSSLDGIYERIVSLEEKLNKYMLETTSKLESINSRLLSLERKRSGEVDVGPVKKIKLDFPEQMDFVRDEKGFVVVFTDGACSHNGAASAKAGIGIWFNHNHPLNVSSPVKGNPTNNTAEIQAARVAIDQARKAAIFKLTIHTDSKFLIKCITEWIYKWKKNGWKLTNGEPVKNKDELVKLDKAISSLTAVEWVHVRGHMGNEGNEMADKLARAGAKRYNADITFGDSSSP